MKGKTPHPVVVTMERMEVLSCLQEEKFDNFVSAWRQQQRLKIVAQSLSTLLAELFESVHLSFTSKFVF